MEQDKEHRTRLFQINKSTVALRDHGLISSISLPDYLTPFVTLPSPKTRLVVKLIQEEKVPGVEGGKK